MAQQRPSTTKYDQQMGMASFKGYEQQGVVDKSDALRIQGMTGLVGELSAFGLDAWKGYEKAKLENEQEAVIDEYMNANHPQQTPALSPVEQNHVDSISQLKNAYEQGAMSPEEFQARILSATKDAVNRTPGFYPDLVEHSRKVLELSGMNGVIKADIESRKTAQEVKNAYFKNVMEAAEKNDIPIDYARIGSDANYAAQINEMTNQVVMRKQAAAVLADAVTTEGNKDKLATEQFINSKMFPAAVRGTLEMFNTDIASLASMANTPQDYNAFVLTAKNKADAIKRQYMSNAGEFINDPRVKQQLDFMVGQLDTTIEAMSTFKSGADVGKYLANQKQMYMDNDYMSFYTTTGLSPAQVDFTSRMLNNPVAANLVNGGKLPLLGKVIDYLEKGIGGATVDKNEAGKPMALDIIKQALDTPQQATSAKILEAAPESILNDIMDKSKYSSLQKYQFQTDYIKQLGSTSYKEAVAGTSDKSRTDNMRILDDYAKTTVQLMNKDFTSLANQGKRIELDILPDGRLNVVGDIPSKDIAKYVARINDSIGAMANLMNTDTKTAAEKYFYPKYFKESSQAAPASTSTTAPTSSTPAKSKNPITSWLGADGGELDDGIVSDIKRYMRESVGEQAVPIDEARQEEILSQFRDMGNRIRERIKVEKVAAQEHNKNRKEYESGSITYEQFLERSSSLNNALKANLKELKNAN